MPAPFLSDPYTRPTTPAIGMAPRTGYTNYGPRANSNYTPMASRDPYFGSGRPYQGDRAADPYFGSTPTIYSPSLRSQEQLATPIIPSVKYGLQSAPFQSQQARQDQMTMATIHQNVELPPPTPTTRLAAQAGTSSGVSEQNLHQMYTTIQQQHPTLSPQDHAQMFNDTAARYGYNGSALLDKWGGQGIANTQSFPTGQMTSAPGAPGMPVSMLGPSNSAGNSIAARVPGLSSKEAGMTVGGSAPGMATPVMGPMQGMTTPAPGMALRPTPSSPLSNDVNDQAMAKMYATRDAASTPVPQDDQARIARNDLMRVRALGDSEMANLAPTPREQFSTAADVAQSAAQVPVAVAQTNAQGKVDAAGKLAQGRVDAAQAKGAAGGKASATPQDQRVSVATTQLRSALERLRSAPNKDAAAAAQQEVITRAQNLDAAQKDREAGTAPPGATTQPTSAGPPAINGNGSPDPYAKGQQQMPNVTTQADYDAIPDGAQFTYNGQTLTKGQKGS